MSVLIRATLFATFALLLAACGGNDAEQVAEESAQLPEKKVSAPDVTFKPSGPADRSPGKMTPPFSVEYKVIGTPIVGSPVPIELKIRSRMGTRPIRMGYNINDTSSMEFPDAQPASVTLTPAANEDYVEQMVTVIPQREGRLYINVSAALESEGGSRSMVVAVPIEVGPALLREAEDNGELGVDEEGEAIRSLPAEEN
jgi:hypothetical protein